MVFIKHFCFNNICIHVTKALFFKMDVLRGGKVGIKVGEAL